MKRKLPLISVYFVIILGLILMFYQSQKMNSSNELEDKRQEVVDQLANNLGAFNPTLAAFVDDDYKSIVASKITSEGTYVFDRGLAENKFPFGNYIVTYDLKDMEIISEELIVTNPKYLDKWRQFKEVTKK
ncbi:hypothetical protein [Pontibacillus marinus]|uniref:Uncharacterized protein n=1 Tax=Pontibacillus marinus BH030004 = DSM 16465 TaxID=1385511 RepID=A0A0A5I2U0_9BACI|nr:hypothetical protein [Pontibacillus marinus]KGX90162.1 hypothetical protein N783_01335 [Pontibacillus marinus BH030004 = DSM 16465]